MRRSGISIMAKLIGAIKPLILVMIITIIMGIIGYLVSIFITIFGAFGLLKVLDYAEGIFSIKVVFISVTIFAILRGVLRYAEQSSGHYVAFKLLALIRDKVFKAIRKLAPAKMENKDKGNLIAIITSDIELLEVFYAHTIAPIAIGIITSVIMIIFIAYYSKILALVALIAYFTVGYILPMINSKIGRQKGLEYRNEFGELNTYILESLRGLKESIQFGIGEQRLDYIKKSSNTLDEKQKHLKNIEGLNKALNEAAVTIFTLIMLFTAIKLMIDGYITFGALFICTIAIISSFAPVLALSTLSNNLLQTLASGERVLNLFEEKPVVYDIEDGKDFSYGNININDITFSYNDKNILENLNLNIEKGKITGIIGKSGSGKSTLMKLVMRFWQVNSGEININEDNINNINTKSLRRNISYVTQETFLFDDTIKNNIKIANFDATDEEIIDACKKASIHDFIQSLPNGYDTKLLELGANLSGGERQRIGIARAFLHKSKIMILDEPTSNLDSLNEAIILKALKENSKDKTIIIISHRKSTLNIADTIFKMEEGKLSKVF